MKEEKSMNQINFEEDRVDSITQVDQTKNLSDAVIELRNLEDQITASENHTKDLKEKAKQLSNFDIPKMMQEMNVTKLKLKDGASIEVKPFMAPISLPTSRKRRLTGFEKTA